MTINRLSDEELFTSPLTFMGAPYGRPGPANKAAILGIPFDCGTNMRIGARGGPDSVRQQSALMRRFNPTHADFDPVAALGLVDCGNVRLTPSKIVDAFERTEQAVDRIVAAGAMPVTIGGDGSVTVPVARAVGKKYPQDGGAAHRFAHRLLSLRRGREVQLRHPVHPRRRGRPGRSGILLACRHPQARPTPRASCRAP